MCGIAGFIAREKVDFKEVLQKMGLSMHHRGPDDKGLYFEEHSGVGLSHARLSIIDITETGHQPMISFSGRYIIIYNGEIYNHLEIRKKLETQQSINWRGTSDTETLLYAIENWGLQKSLEHFIGMFAIALYDKQEQKLFLARDRMGEKPLYYGWVNHSFVFGSEIKALTFFPSFDNKISHDSLALFMRHGSIPDPYSIYENISKLPPGNILEYNLITNKIRIENYWSSVSHYKENQLKKFLGTEKQAISKLDELLRNAIDLQMHSSDVPIGAFLSGGVDSSLVSAIMQNLSTVPINTFSIGFDVPEYNEAEFAKTVAKHLGTNHYEQYVTGKDALEVVPKLAQIYEEPFSEASQIPTYLVSKIAKQKVTVCLSGDAGDELFGGYERYNLANSAWNKISKIPEPIRKISSKGIEKLPYSVLQSLFFPLREMKNKTGKTINLADKLVKVAPLLNFTNRKDFYGLGFMTHNLNAEKWVLDSKKTSTIFTNNNIVFPSYFDEMMAIDQATYLPNNNLVKVDRAAMANSLETRVPFLDYRIVDFAQSLPINFKIKNGKLKWILRQVLYQYVPEKLIERPKMGFGVPLAHWLRSDLKDWAEDLLDEKKLKEQGFFNVKIVRQNWEHHISGNKNMQNYLWDVLVFQSWLENRK